MKPDGRVQLPLELRNQLQIQSSSRPLSKAFAKVSVTFRGFHPGQKYAGTRLLQQIKGFGRVAAHLGHASVYTTRKGYV